jgi:hypothetical protein
MVKKLIKFTYYLEKMEENDHMSGIQTNDQVHVLRPGDWQ